MYTKALGHCLFLSALVSSACSRHKTVLNMLFKSLLLTSYLILSAVPRLAFAQTLDLSDLPLFVQSNVAPNMVISMDDSGSMGWGFMPDDRQVGWSFVYFRSSDYNKVYYDPEITYSPPNRADGSVESDAVFRAAIRGYYYPTFQATVDLSASFSAIYYNYSYGDALILDNVYINFCAECFDQTAYYYQYDTDLTVNPTCPATSQSTSQACYSKVVITDATNYTAQTCVDTNGASRTGTVNNECRTLAEEETNFANWYQYYAIRGDAGKSALRRAFVPTSVDESFRVGRQHFNNDTIIGSGAASNDVAELDATERADLYTWIDAVPTDGGTPLRGAVYRAGEYYKNLSAYQNSPGVLGSTVAACRVNTHILVTDGFYNGNFTQPAEFAPDESDVDTLPDGTTYTANSSDTRIYFNVNDTQSISDLTFHYWATDLLPNESNNLTPFFFDDNNVASTDYWDPRNDPAAWQHMNSYSIAFGAEGSVGTDDITYQALQDGIRAWPTTIIGTDTTIDDLYHSSINGRGAYFNAANPDDLVDALKKITDRLESLQANAPTVVANSGRIGGNSLIYVAAFDTGSWSGDLQAFDVSDASEVGNGSTGCNSQSLGTLCGSAVWSVADNNTENSAGMAPANRKIFTYLDTATQPGTPAGTGVEFKWASLDGTQKTLLNQADGFGENRVNYLRGDSSNELDSGGDFRTRSSLNRAGPASRVGPIVNSPPVYVGNGLDSNGRPQFAFPDDLEARAYSSFISSSEVTDRPPIIYAGANDGMLHAYNAERSTGNGGGDEVFAYIPNKVYEDLHELTDPGFRTDSFVDGPITVQDIYDGTKWLTLLVGGLRTGGQGVYALDVTSPQDDINSGASGADALVLWEFTDTDDIDMGFSFGKPQIVRANNGDWVVLISSGYNSTIADGRIGTGDAFLYVLKAATGKLIRKIAIGSGISPRPNGLSTPVAASDRDVNNFLEKSTGTDEDDFTVDYVYAGDLNGDMWRIDVSSTNDGLWGSSLLYSAGADRPITAQPAVGTALRRAQGVGNTQNRVVYFGTGQYIEPGDIATTAQQYYYGLIDDDTCASGSGAACITESDLVLQTISPAGTVTDNPLDQAKKGWLIGLQSSSGSSSERVIGRGFLLGSVLLFTSVLPSGDSCAAGGDGFLYALDRFSGGATDFQVLDLGTVSTLPQLGDTENTVARKKLGEWTGDIAVFSGASNSHGVSGEGVAFSATEATVINPFDRVGRVRWRQLK